MRKKLVGIFIFSLILGVIFIPGITATREIVEKKDLNNDLVEITVEVVNREHKILLTSDQAVELENLIERTKTRLDKATTLEETSQIFDETVISLYELGLLPDGISVEDAQRLVNGNNRFSRLGKVLNHLSSSKPGLLDDESNLFCLIAGATSNTFFYPLSLRVSFYMLYNQENDLVMMLSLILALLSMPLWGLWSLSPVVFGNNACLGSAFGWGFPSSGWVFTIGLKGINIWDGSFYGGITSVWTFIFENRVGFRGFTGLKIKYNSQIECFYLGYVTEVKLEYA